MPLTPEEEAELAQLKGQQAGPVPTPAKKPALNPDEEKELIGLKNDLARMKGSNSAWEDIKHGFVPWGYQAAENIRSLPGTLGDLALAGVQKAGEKLGIDKLAGAAKFMREQNQPYTANARIEAADKANPKWDVTYQPQTRPGAYTQAGMAIAPQMALGGPASLAKAVPTAIGSVEGEKLAERLPDWLQPYAKPVGAALGGAAGYGVGSIPGRIGPKVTPEFAKSVETVRAEGGPMTAAHEARSPLYSWMEQGQGQKPPTPDLTKQALNIAGINPKPGESVYEAAQRTSNTYEKLLQPQGMTPPVIPPAHAGPMHKQWAEVQAIRNAAEKNPRATTFSLEDMDLNRPGRLRNFAAAAKDVYGSTPEGKAPLPGAGAQLAPLGTAAIGAAAGAHEGLGGAMRGALEGSIPGMIQGERWAQIPGNILRPVVRSGPGQAAMKGMIRQGESVWLPPANRAAYLNPSLAAATLGLKNYSNNTGQ